jgi:outer membrane protein with beta-barrel domain
MAGCALATVLAAPSAAQEPSGPPPPPVGRGTAGPQYHELLPDIGLIGAQVGIAVGASWNPFEVGRGIQAAGYVDLPLARVGGGKLSYEILVGLSNARSEPFIITDQIAFVANLAAGASREAALAGPPEAPFPVRREVRTELRLLQVSPFGLKYTLRRLGSERLRPYVGAGLDFAVTITNQDPVADESLEFRGTAPFDAPLIGGAVAQAPELEERGYPTGQGNIDFGFHAGGGMEVRVARRLSVNVEYRFTAIGSGDALHTVTAALGMHW